MDQEKMNEAAKNTFAVHPKADKIWQTTDGQCFTQEQAAYSHSYNCADRTVKEISRPTEEIEEVESTPSLSKDLGAEEAEKAVAKLDTVEAIEAFIEGDKRKGVNAAAETRKLAIETAEAQAKEEEAE